MTTLLSPSTKQRFFDNNGNPLAFGLLTTYAAGTTNPITTYKDSTGGPTNTNPIVLNFRGECDIWLQPNIAYKFALTDAQGNTIPGWPIDNILNSQLITLYGGVDAGSVNAYVLNFTANFTAYVDGIVIYWLVSHTNTGPSTINVNGLGVVNITNQDGTALGGGTLIQNQIATMMYKGGAFLLLSTGNVAVNNTFTGTLTGMLAATTGTVKYFIIGRVCILQAAITGTSNSTSLTMTGLPSQCIPQTGAALIACMLQDNGASLGGWAAINSGTGTITFGTGFNNNQSGFTAAGTKGLPAGWTVTYPIN